MTYILSYVVLMKYYNVEIVSAKVPFFWYNIERLQNIDSYVNRSMINDVGFHFKIYQQHPKAVYVEVNTKYTSSC